MFVNYLDVQIQFFPSLNQLILGIISKIYQWNADGIRPKFPELYNLLINSDIYVLAVQESKLRKVDKALFIEGYVTVRKDHNNILGGVLLLFLQTDTA